MWAVPPSSVCYCRLSTKKQGAQERLSKEEEKEDKEDVERAERQGIEGQQIQRICMLLRGGMERG